jgi:hypothetical protein
MKSFRRSLGDKSKDSPAASHGTGLPTTLSKPTASIQPPKKVIRAKESHVSTSPQELPFSKGDFFYVVGERDDPNGGPGYYEALSEWQLSHLRRRQDRSSLTDPWSHLLAQTQCRTPEGSSRRPSSRSSAARAHMAAKAPSPRAEAGASPHATSPPLELGH